MLTKRTLIFWLVGLAVVFAGAQGQEKMRPQPQLHFSAEQEIVDRPVTLPRDVLQVLKEDEGVATIQEI